MRRPYPLSLFFFFNDTATTEIYTLSLHDALPICVDAFTGQQRSRRTCRTGDLRASADLQLDAVDGRTHGDVADRQGVAHADRGFRTADDRCADFQVAQIGRASCRERV